jgi:hypothetical protein
MHRKPLLEILESTFIKQRRGFERIASLTRNIPRLPGIGIEVELAHRHDYRPPAQWI